MKHLKAAARWVRALPLLYSVGGALVVLLIAWMFWPSSVEQKTLRIERKAFVQEVSVSGKVIPAQEVDLGFSQGGRITNVYVSVGQYVAQGATLAVVENGDLRAMLLQREAALENQEAKLAALKAGTRPEEVAIAQSDVDSNKNALIDELQDAFRAADGAVHNTVDQFINNPHTAPTLTFQLSDANLKSKVENDRLTAEAKLATWGSEVNALSSSSDLPAAVLRATANLTYIVGLLSDANAAINRGLSNAQTPQSTLDSYSAAVSTARTNVNAAMSGVTSANAALSSSQKTLALKLAGSTVQDIEAQEAQIKAAQADVAQAQAQLNKTYISAPFSGTVTVVDAKPGKTVSSGSTEISMISNGAFQIESYVPEINIALLAVGDQAQVSLDAYGDERFSARVVSLDPAETVRDGVATYRALLQFSTSDTRIKSGMTASVSIVTDTKQDVLSIPQGLVERRGSKTYVQVVSKEGIAEREVELGGVSSLGEVEILAGLSEGEELLAELP